MKRATITAAALAALLTAPALAQTAPPAGSKPATPPATSSDVTGTAGGAAKPAETFATKAMPGEWRASKLAGVDIYGPDNKSIGKVDDVVVDQSGDSKVVVIAVGGVLGIGAKNVAVPFETVKWSSEPVKPTPAPAPPGGAPASGTAGTAPAGTTGTTPSTPAVHDYPDHGMVDMTLDQLKSAPEFKYASQK